MKDDFGDYCTVKVFGIASQIFKYSETIGESY